MVFNDDYFCGFPILSFISPFGLAGDSKEDLIFKREAEIKHSRLAMLAAVGWPIAELFDRKIAGFLGINDSLTPTGQAPSLLNGGLEKIEPEFWVILVSVAGLAEIGTDETKEEKGDKFSIREFDIYL